RVPSDARPLAEAALQQFRALGMTGWIRRAEALLADSPAVVPAREAPAPPVAPRLARAAFEREGEYWSITFDGRTIRLRHTAGLGCLADLLAAPNQDVAALVLAGANGSPAWLGDAAPVLDPQARTAYRARLADMKAERDEAEAAHDLGRTAQLDEEMAFLAAE